MLTKFLCNNRRPQQKHHSHQHQRQRQQQLAFRPIVNLKDGCFLTEPFDRTIKHAS